MKLIKNLADYKGRFDNTVVSIGNFDGVHIGHQHIINNLVKDAALSGRKSVVFTFDRNTKEIINPLGKPMVITPLSKKIGIIQNLGVDVLAVINLQDGFAAYGPEDFVSDILCAKFGMKKIVVGPDFRFGRNRAGDADFLKQMGKHHGFQIEVLPFIEYDGTRVSSSGIRSLFSQGRNELACRMLGREFA